MTISRMHAVLERLNKAASGPTPDPYLEIVWPEQLDLQKWCMPPQLISLHGTPAYEAMDEAARRRLSLLELVNFFSMNVHGERLLIAGLQTHVELQPDDVARYLGHFRIEEEKHLACFVRFCESYGDGVYRDRNLAFAEDWHPAEATFVFFARVLIFEELVDQINTTLAADDDVHPVVRQINRAHHLEEVRHLAFGRAWLRHLASTTTAARSEEGRQRIGRYLSSYRGAMWRELFNPDVYGDAGLADALHVRSAALGNEQARQRCERLFARSDRFLLELGLPIEALPA